MKTLFQCYIKPVWILNTMIPFELMRLGEIYISEQYNTSSHICLCGRKDCGMQVVLPFNKTDHVNPNFWDLVKEKNGTISIIGSVGNFQFPCKSHYIITKNVANFLSITPINP